METYPILIRGSTTKLVKIKATHYGQAVLKALDKYRNKFINYKHAKHMDLISARVDAAGLSKKSGKKQYVVLDKSGDGDEFKITDKEPSNPDEIYATYSNGSELKFEAPKPVKQAVDEILSPSTVKKSGKQDTKKPEQQKGQPTKPAVEEVSKKSNSKNMSTAKTKPAKKTAPAKKESPKVEKKATKPSDEKGVVSKATTVHLKPAQWEKLYKVSKDKGKSIQILSTEALIKQYSL